MVLTKETVGTQSELGSFMLWLENGLRDVGRKARREAGTGINRT